MMAVNCRISLDGKQPDQISEDCIICCEIVTDKAFVNNCLHYFCFKCIKEWIKIRAVCPLCVQPIDSIINNVRSADDYDLQPVEPPETDVLSNYLDADMELWATVDDDDDDFVDDVALELSSDEAHAANSSTDSDDDAVNDYHYAMDEDSNDDSDASFGDAEANSPQGIELFSNSDDDEEEEEAKSCGLSNSEMEDDAWQVEVEDDAWQVEDTESENSDNDDYVNDGNDSDEIEILDYTYNHLDDSDDNDDAYEALSESEDGYEYLSDEDDDYGHDEGEDDSDSDYY